MRFQYLSRERFRTQAVRAAITEQVRKHCGSSSDARLTASLFDRFGANDQTGASLYREPLGVSVMAAASSEVAEWAGGEVLFCGATDWAMIGRQSNKPKKGDPPVRRRKDASRHAA